MLNECNDDDGLRHKKKSRKKLHLINFSGAFIVNDHQKSEWETVWNGSLKCTTQKLNKLMVETIEGPTRILKAYKTFCYIAIFMCVSHETIE